MKFAILALSAFAAVVQARDCNTLALVRIVAGPNGEQCKNESGYSAITGKLPTKEQYNVLCYSDICMKYREELKAAEPTECTINGVFPQPTPLYATLITPIEEECKKIRTPAPTTGSPTPTTGGPTPTTGGPTPTTGKPSC